MYYWYGENKEKTLPDNDIWHWGVRCYTSTDLYNWEDKGLIIPPEPDNPESSLHPSASMDRPHIIYNQRTKKFVCWLKIMNRDQTQTETVLTADHILGPYTKVREGLRPPYVREATAHFLRRGKHYLVTSGTTGYLPNPSEVAVGESWHGPYRVLGNPHPGDESNTSYHSQISSVFKVPGKKDLYIACADRWLPEEMEQKYEDYARMFELIFDPDADKAELAELMKEKMPEGAGAGNQKENTSIADYIWLPFRFDGEMAYLDWKEEWRLEDYE